MTEAEQHAEEVKYARARLVECGRTDLVTLLEFGEITPSEAFVRLHRRKETPR